MQPRAHTDKKFELKYKFFADYSERFIDTIDKAWSYVFTPSALLFLNFLVCTHATSNIYIELVGVVYVVINLLFHKSMFIPVTVLVKSWHDEVRRYGKFMEESVYHNEHSVRQSKKSGDSDNPLVQDELPTSEFVDLHEHDDYYFMQLEQQLQQDQLGINTKHLQDRVVAVFNVCVFVLRLFYCDNEPTYGWVRQLFITNSVDLWSI